MRWLLVCLIALVLVGCSEGPKTPDAKPQVLVSILPQRMVVSRIAGDTVEVTVIVPPGMSPHTFDLKPQKAIEASKATLWFRIGEPFEDRAVRAFAGSSMQIVDMRDGLPLIALGDGHCCHHHEGAIYDTHFWLSPKMAKLQAERVAEILSAAYPAYRALYAERLQTFLVELSALDQQIAAILRDLPERTLMVTHPSFAYFCRDYDLRQLSVEIEGHDPSPRELTELLEEARTAHVSRIFVQQRHPHKATLLLAKELGMEVVEFDPYKEEALELLPAFAQLVADE